MDFIKEYKINEQGGKKCPINKWGGKFENQVGLKKCKQGGEKSKNDNRVDSFIWHPRVHQLKSYSCQLAAFKATN